MSISIKIITQAGVVGQVKFGKALIVWAKLKAKVKAKVKAKGKGKGEALICFWKVWRYQ